MIPPFLDTFVSEKFAINLIANHLKVNKEKAIHYTEKNRISPIDFSLDGKTYDVKFANKGKEPEWDFCIRGKGNYCDYFICIGMINQRPQKVFLIPGKNAPLHHIRISIDGKSKWHQYLIWSWK